MLTRQATWGHGSYTFNEDRTSTGAVDPTKDDDRATLLQVRRSPGFRSQRDVYHLTQGGSPGRIVKGLLALQLSGALKVPASQDQMGDLNDREAALRAAFDPTLCDHDSPTTFGVYTFDFYEATNVVGYSGWIPLRAYCRPESGVEITDQVNDQDNRAFGVTLVCFDPRLFEQTEVTRTLTPSTLSGTLINAGNSPSPLKATITMAGAGAANFTITRGSTTFVLDLSACANHDVVTVVFEACAPYGKRAVSLNGVEKFALKVSPVTPTWMDVPIGTNTFVISNTTNVTTCVLGTYSARV
jgi:hypothetical protein